MILRVCFGFHLFKMSKINRISEGKNGDNMQSSSTSVLRSGICRKIHFRNKSNVNILLFYNVDVSGFWHSEVI